MDKTFLDLVARPFGDADLGRLQALVERVDAGSGFIGLYSHERRVGITATIVDGAVMGWMLFPARDEAAARQVAQLLHQAAEHALPFALAAGDQAAAAVIEKARGG